jgi:hypothetical protein
MNRKIISPKLTAAMAAPTRVTGLYTIGGNNFLIKLLKDNY